jgi:hypothetical protein
MLLEACLILTEYASSVKDTTVSVATDSLSNLPFSNIKGSVESLYRELTSSINKAIDEAFLYYPAT